MLLHAKGVLYTTHLIGGDWSPEGFNMLVSINFLICPLNFLLPSDVRGSLENISIITHGCDLNLPGKRGENGCDKTTTIYRTYYFLLHHMASMARRDLNYICSL